MFFLLLILGISNKCLPCVGNQFLSLNICHKTGFIKNISDNEIVSCVPEDKSTYYEALIYVIILSLFAGIFIISVKYRRSYLLNGVKYS